jgi:uncharacterized protein (DUF1697 family)
MSTYIALLRGINVSGQKLIKMAELREYLAELNYTNIKTYIQSGNIVFDTDNNSCETLETEIHNKIKEKYGFEVPTLVKSPDEFNEAVKRNPFAEEDPKRVYITFLSHTPELTKVESLKEVDYSPEKYVIDSKVVYFYSPDGYGKAKMNNNFFENKLKVDATTRNWKTVNVLIEMSTQQ